MASPKILHIGGERCVKQIDTKTLAALIANHVTSRTDASVRSLIRARDYGKVAREMKRRMRRYSKQVNAPKPAPKPAVPLDVVCPHCGAGIGERCVSANGKRLSAVHKARIEAVGAAAHKR